MLEIIWLFKIGGTTRIYFHETFAPRFYVEQIMDEK